MNKINVMLLGLSLLHLSTMAQDATEIVRRSDEKLHGEKTSFSTMSMKIVRPTWERTISMKSWTKGTSMSMTIVTAPAAEEGQAFLKRGNEMWNWNPTIQRMIKLPPSMMSKGWMGSDYTNDDIMNESSIVKDYEHSIVGNETIEGMECYKIELIPHEDAPVVWGKVMLWISKEGYHQLKSEFYDEDNYLQRTIYAANIKEMDGRTIPTKLEIVPADEEGNKTVVVIESIEFNKPISDDFFSQQNMKRLRP